MKAIAAVDLVNTTEDQSSSLQGIETDQTPSIILSMLVGGIIGWAIGIAQLIFIGSWELLYWPFVSLIPLYSALGGVLYGMILGASGIFSKARTKTSKCQSGQVFGETNAA